MAATVAVAVAVGWIITFLYPELLRGGSSTPTDINKAGIGLLLYGTSIALAVLALLALLVSETTGALIALVSAICFIFGVYLLRRGFQPPPPPIQPLQ